jgi:hypothetical protein
MNNSTDRSELIESFIQKSSLKQKVYANTLKIFGDFKEVIREIYEESVEKVSKHPDNLLFKVEERGNFELKFTFGSDVLIFLMHTNVFEFPRDHIVMKTSYVKEDVNRSYCGVIRIYNFIADSFKYNRINDIGYMIGRVFVNKDFHYFIEGKRELGFLYSNFVDKVIDLESIRKIVESAINYTIKFDLLTPPFDTVKEVSVLDMKNTLDNMKLRTGKRLGFRFQGDHQESNGK